MKKAFGIILIIISIIVGIGILLTIPNTIISVITTFRENTIYQWGYLLGSLFVTIITTVLTFFLMRLGIKLLNK